MDLSHCEIVVHYLQISLAFGTFGLAFGALSRSLCKFYVVCFL